MVNMTLAVPEELSQMMKNHGEIRWSEIARRALWEHARRLELMEKIVAKSKFTMKDALEIGEKVKKGMARAHGLG